MSIQSMTGFGRAESEGEKYSMTVEIKTVNHRFKDVRFKMGSVFNSKEISLKKKVDAKFTRGSFDVYVNYRKIESLQKKFELDYDKIQDFLTQMKEVAQRTNSNYSFQPTEFLRNDFYKEDSEKEDELVGMLDEVFERALLDLESSRNEEGGKLIQTLQMHQKHYNEFFEKVIGSKDKYQDKVREKLKKRFDDEKFELSIDEPRFLQEVIYYLEKLDIDEETNRIAIHLEKLSSILKSSGDVGRQIDFLVQELNRETNTIGSKSGESVISESVVQMKVQLEKIREQALNLQ